ncbi:MAG TPA: helix-turn-helix domain-containing protein [Rhizobiaceae bacterium]|nr:helix-turn-helix domain-containing protein [Rhizobiaceae bacterium]
MTKYRKSDALPARAWIDDLPEDRRSRIDAGAARIVRQAHLAELRKALNTTQAELSSKSGMKQAEISRIEHHPETVQIRTMERYVRSLGGEFKIVAEFPDGTSAEIPLHGGKPVKSRLKVERKKKHDDAGSPLST